MSTNWTVWNWTHMGLCTVRSLALSFSWNVLSPPPRMWTWRNLCDSPHGCRASNIHLSGRWCSTPLGTNIEFLNHQFHEHWTGHDRPVLWPPWSPDITLRILLWGFINDKMLFNSCSWCWLTELMMPLPAWLQMCSSTFGQSIIGRSARLMTYMSKFCISWKKILWVTLITKQCCYMY